MVFRGGREAAAVKDAPGAVDGSLLLRALLRFAPTFAPSASLTARAETWRRKMRTRTGTRKSAYTSLSRVRRAARAREAAGAARARARRRRPSSPCYRSVNAPELRRAFFLAASREHRNRPGSPRSPPRACTAPGRVCARCSGTRCASEAPRRTRTRKETVRARKRKKKRFFASLSPQKAARRDAPRRVRKTFSARRARGSTVPFLFRRD